jgi:hypothetical protein
MLICVNELTARIFLDAELYVVLNYNIPMMCYHAIYVVPGFANIYVSIYIIFLSR